MKSAFALIYFNGFWTRETFGRFAILSLTTCSVPGLLMNVSLCSGSTEQPFVLDSSIEGQSVATCSNLFALFLYYQSNSSGVLQLTHKGKEGFIFPVTAVACRTPSSNAFPCIASGFISQVGGSFQLWSCSLSNRTMPRGCNQPVLGFFFCKKTRSRRSCCALCCGNSSPRQTLLANPQTLSKPRRSPAVHGTRLSRSPKGLLLHRGLEILWHRLNWENCGFSFNSSLNCSFYYFFFFWRVRGEKTLQVVWKASSPAVISW